MMTGTFYTVCLCGLYHLMFIVYLFTFPFVLLLSTHPLPVNENFPISVSGMGRMDIENFTGPAVHKKILLIINIRPVTNEPQSMLS